MRDGILRLNAAHGVPTTPTRGYHETITRFYVRVICDYVANKEERPAGSWPERVTRLLDRYGDRELPLRHYTKDLLMSQAARFGWVEPDLLPIGPRRSAADQLPPQLGHPAADRAVVDALAHPHHRPAQDLGIHVEGRRGPPCRADGSAPPGSSRWSAGSAGRRRVTPARTRLCLMSSSVWNSVAISRRSRCRPRFTTAWRKRTNSRGRVLQRGARAAATFSPLGTRGDMSTACTSGVVSTAPRHGVDQLGVAAPSSRSVSPSSNSASA